MSQNIPDESQTPTEQPTGAALLGKMSEAISTLQEAQEHLVNVAKDVAKHTTDPNAHGAATLANIAKAMPKPVIEDGMFSFKDADGNDIIDPVNLKGDTGEKGEKGDDGAKGDKGDKGDDGAKGDKGDMPDHQWDGTSLQMQKPDGTWGEAQDLRGPKGEDGSNGIDGAPGQAPEHQWNGTSLQFKNPDGTWGEEQNLQGPQGAPGEAAVATEEQPGIVQPDGKTVTVDEDGILSALGGNLLLNSEMLITESGEWEAPVKGWYHVRLQDGGDGGYIVNRTDARGFYGGSSGKTDEYFLYFNKGDVVPVIIGAGGPSLISSTPSQFAAVKGGATSFGDYVCRYNNEFFGDVYRGVPLTGTASLCDAAGAGPGGRSPYSPGVEEPDGFKYYGSGGSAYLSVVGGEFFVSEGGDGCVIIRYYDPAKAAGPAAAPALLSARRMAPRAVNAPATVNLYDPETGQGSVWREEDAEAKLAEGMITEAAWLEISAAKAAEEYAAWLASPDTVAERFAMLRAARDARLAATDYLVAPDYPLTEEHRALVTAYRQALRDLPAEAGAPWDGGGELTPWPEAPVVSNVQTQPEEPEQTEEIEG